MQVALYVPADETLKVVPVIPVFQVIFPSQPVAVRVVKLPAQMFTLPAIVGGFGIEFTTIVCVIEAALTQLFTIQITL